MTYLVSTTSPQNQLPTFIHVDKSFDDTTEEFTALFDQHRSSRVWSPEQLELSAAFLNEDKDAQRDALRKLGYLNDADTLAMLAEVSSNDTLAEKCGDMAFFWTNKSSLSYQQLQVLYCSRMPAVLDAEDNPKIFAGYHHDRRTPKPVVQGIFCRFNEIKSIPRGYDKVTGTYYRSERPLPRLMSAEIDIKGAAGIFENHPAQPFFTAENPVTGHCHVGFLIKYNAEEWIHYKRTAQELKSIWKEFTYLIGGDPAYDGHTIRSPWFITGFHKNKPASDTRNLINTNTESTYHKSVFYEPHEYTIQELREIVADLKALHGDQVRENPAKMRINSALPDVGIKPEKVGKKPSRNESILNTTRHYAYTIAYRYSINSFDAFVHELMGYASRQNYFSGKPPLPAYELRATCKSIAKFCVQKNFKRPCHQYDHSSELQSLRARRRWGYNYETNRMKATAEGISESTFYPRQTKKNRSDAAHAHARVASAHVENLFKSTSVYKDQSVTPVFFPLIKKGYCHPQSVELMDVTYESTGPPFDG